MPWAGYTRPDASRSCSRRAAASGCDELAAAISEREGFFDHAFEVLEYDPAAAVAIGDLTIRVHPRPPLRPGLGFLDPRPGRPADRRSPVTRARTRRSSRRLAAPSCSSSKSTLLTAEEDDPRSRSPDRRRGPRHGRASGGRSDRARPLLARGSRGDRGGLSRPRSGRGRAGPDSWSISSSARQSRADESAGSQADGESARPASLRAPPALADGRRRPPHSRRADRPRPSRTMPPRPAPRRPAPPRLPRRASAPPALHRRPPPGGVRPRRSRPGPIARRAGPRPARGAAAGCSQAARQ